MTFGLITLSTWLGCHAYRRFALRTGFLDHPGHRSAHEVPTPTGAGTIMVALFFVSVLLVALDGQLSRDVVMALPAVLLVAAIGLIDDAVALPWRIRAPVHVGAAAWCIYWIGFPMLPLPGAELHLGFAGSLFGIVALVWLLNLYNFMDGIDGLAAGEAVFVTTGAWLLGGGAGADWSVINLCLLAVTLGFLVINWPRAQVFMGDVGSGFVGLMLGMLVLGSVDVGVWTWMILLGYFVTDACLTITTRLVRGDNIAESHSLHAYQHLARAFGSRNTRLGIMAVNLLWLLPIAFLSEVFQGYGALLLILAALPLLVGQHLCGAGRLKPTLAVLAR
ncbi:MAG: glycosyltransferase family 4 protein [Proteobacteria bacterium]|nr:glycosyltransferase family 4 protein [Pseudomonadota bacterium]